MTDAVRAALDPTGTTGIRNRYESDVSVRFRRVSALARQALGEQDALGLRATLPTTSSVEKIIAFTDWFYRQEQRIILGIAPGTSSAVAQGDNWQVRYIRSAYDKGRRDALRYLQRIQDARRKLPPDDRVRIIQSRVFTELEGISDETARRLSRILSQGVARGDSPEVIARAVTRSTDISITRARTLVRTELISAHAEASLNVYEEAGLKKVKVKAEFATAGDDAVCPLCEDYEGKIMTIAQARGLIPVHPRCRCAWLPV